MKKIENKVFFNFYYFISIIQLHRNTNNNRILTDSGKYINIYGSQYLNPTRLKYIKKSNIHIFEVISFTYLLNTLLNVIYYGSFRK